MPFIGGPITINNVGGAAILGFGDTVFISKTATKAYHGSGSANTGGLLNTVSVVSLTNTIQSDLIDQPIVKDI